MGGYAASGGQLQTEKKKIEKTVVGRYARNNQTGRTAFFIIGNISQPPPHSSWRFGNGGGVLMLQPWGGCGKVKAMERYIPV
jgi:hypothetical protein